MNGDTPMDASDGVWMPKIAPVKDLEDAVPVPPAVKAEEEFLDAVVSHIDEDRSDIVQLRDKVSEWYDQTDGQVTPIRRAKAGAVDPDSSDDSDDLPDAA